MADRGTVIKASGNRAFIMNERCEFLEIKTFAALQPGDRIEYSPHDIVRSGRRPVGALAVAASFIIVCLIAFTAFQHMLTGKVYAYIGMEINPGIEMGINSEHKVVRLRGYNDEGKRLISSRDLLNYDIKDALRIIIRDCREGDYLSREIDNDIAVSVHIPGDADSRGFMKQVDATVKTALAENGVNARIHFFSIDKRTMEQAGKQNVSPLKYMLWEEAGRMGYTTPLQSVSLRDPRIKEIAAEKEEKITGGGVTKGSETPPSGGPAVVVPAGENQEGREAGGQMIVPTEQGPKPASRNDTAKPVEAEDNAANRAGKDSGQPDGEVTSPKNASGNSHRENKGPGGGPMDGAEGKKPEDKGLVGPSAGKTKDGKETETTENAGSVTGEAAGAGKVKTNTDGGVEVGGSTGGGSGSGGGGSPGGSGPSGSSSGGGGGSGGGSSGGKGR